MEVEHAYDRLPDATCSQSQLAASALFGLVGLWSLIQSIIGFGVALNLWIAVHALSLADETPVRCACALATAFGLQSLCTIVWMVSTRCKVYTLRWRHCQWLMVSLAVPWIFCCVFDIEFQPRWAQLHPQFGVLHVLATLFMALAGLAIFGTLCLRVDSMRRRRLFGSMFDE